VCGWLDLSKSPFVLPFPALPAPLPGTRTILLSLALPSCPSMRVYLSFTVLSLHSRSLNCLFSISFPFLSPCRFRSRSLAFSLSFSSCTHARSPLLALAPAARFRLLSSYTLSPRLSFVHPRCEKSHSGRPRTCRFPNLGARQAEGL